MRTLKKIEVYLFVIIIALLSLNKAFFTHTHYFNGQLITHAHPFKKSNKSSTPASHQHSECQYIQLSNLDNISPTENIKVQEIFQVFESNIELPSIIVYYNNHPSYFLTRGPPSIIS